MNKPLRQSQLELGGVDSYVRKGGVDSYVRIGGEGVNACVSVQRGYMGGMKSLFLCVPS